MKQTQEMIKAKISSAIIFGAEFHATIKGFPSKTDIDLYIKENFAEFLQAQQEESEAGDRIKWNEWMSKYPTKNGLYLIVPRGKKETWVGWWNDSMRRFEKAVPEFVDTGIDVDLWAELPTPVIESPPRERGV